MGADEGRQPGLFSYEELCGEGQPARAGAEPREQPEAPTRARSIEADEPDIATGDATDLLERICSRENMRTACERVAGNGGAGGAGGMDVRDLPAWPGANYGTPADRVLRGAYRPRPVRRAEIPKGDGRAGLLGIPTAVDRMTRQAVAQVLAPMFEPAFHDRSFGFRPGRSAHDAIAAVAAEANAGNAWVASMDLERFFDLANKVFVRAQVFCARLR